MPEYRCICCGTIKESDFACSCPECGSRMFDAKYDRRTSLTQEISRFITSLEKFAVTKDDLLIEKNGKRSNEFPSYNDILLYITGKERTEAFFDALMKTCEQMKVHFSSSFSDTYDVSLDGLNNRKMEYEDALLRAVKTLVPDVSLEFEPVELGKISVCYRENQNRYLWFSAHELINLIEKLAEKIVKFIRCNNLYGEAHQYSPERINGKYTEQTDYKEELEKAIFETEKIIREKYDIDIFDDGIDEITEMLTILWQDIDLVLSAPLFIESYEYSVNNVAMNESEFFDYISNKISDRYATLNRVFDIVGLCRIKSEDELFEIYNSLLKCDSFGILASENAEITKKSKSEKRLDNLIGLSEIKNSIKKIKAYALANKDSNNLNVHMCFLGNPGSGKTEVARIVADILFENKILPTNKVVEVDRSGLVSQYFGATAEKTSRVIQSAMGGVLFIDEAYALANNSDRGISDYGKEAIDTLVKAMEDYRGKFCVIFAGYKNEMQAMISSNPGLKSRIQFILDFPNYSREELKKIAEQMLYNRGYAIGQTALNRVLDITDIRRKEPNFANAREIRNILDHVIMCQNVRVMGAEDNLIGNADVSRYIADAKLKLPIKDKTIASSVLSAEEELDQLVGLGNVKRIIKKIKAYAKKNKDEADFNMHMCFYGNPGTGKTEVARILSRILYDSGVLQEAKMVETDGNGLLGSYVGETAPKTMSKINEAMNGVLFIDEAYSLASGGIFNGASNYGDEAVTVLLKEMEDKRGRFCVILAGYKEETMNLINSNPGFKSRIQFVIDFPDYTRNELREIALSFAKNKKYDIEEDALNLILDITDYYRDKPNFANARTVRNILDQVIMNQNLRTEDACDDYMIILSDVEDYVADEAIDVKTHSA